jgi:HSP20 family protein
MKRMQFNIRRKRFAAGILVLLLAGATRLLATDSQGSSTNFLDQVQKWENEMTDKFRDTFKDLRADNKENSISSASLDLREQKDSYTVRLNLPGRDLSKAEISLEGSSLHVVAPAEANAGRYEQSVDLPDATLNGKLVIDRNQKDNLIVVTVPKGLATAKAEASPFGLAPLPLSDWDREMFDRMQKMQEDMDRVFDDSFRQFQNEPDLKGFFDQRRFGSSVDLQDEGGSYVVKAYLPNRDMQNVSVTLTNQTLNIEAKAQDRKEDGKNGPNIIQEAEYSQEVTLPGPVNASKMKVDKKEGMLIITLPKTDSK